MKVAGLHYRRLKNVYSTSKWTYEQKQKAHRAILAACTGGAGIKDGKMTIITIKDKKDENIYSN
jgi:transcriptional regulatory protein LevR